jgi:hypothetical protein
MVRSLRRLAWGFLAAIPLVSANAAAQQPAENGAAGGVAVAPASASASVGVSVGPAPSSDSAKPSSPSSDSAKPSSPSSDSAKPSSPSSDSAKPSSPAASPSKSEEKSDSAPLFTGTARFADPYYEVGVVGGAGGLVYSAATKTPTLTGVRVFEHHGYIARAFMGLLVALGQSNSRYVGSSYSTDGRYVYRTDYYRPLTAGERAAQAQALSDAVGGKYSAEFVYYAPNLLGLDPTGSRSRGFESSIGGDISLGSGGGGLPAILTIGGYGAYIQGAPELRTQAATTPATTTQRADVSYSNIGLMLRLHYPINKVVDVSAEWDANILSLFGDKNLNSRTTSPLKVGAYVNLTDRVYLRGQGILGGFGVSGGKLGGQGELGFRF